MRNLKYDANEFIYETDSQTQRTDMWPRGKGHEEGWSGRQGLTDVNYYIERMDKQQFYFIAQGLIFTILWKTETEKKYIYITESLCYKVESSTTL